VRYGVVKVNGDMRGRWRRSVERLAWPRSGC
jgi:hypothetical protein